MIPSADLRFDGCGNVLLKGAGSSAGDVRGFCFNDETVAYALWKSIPPHLADLLSVGMSVYLADRVVPRRALGAPQFALAWKRQLSLEIPVNQPERWAQEEVQDALRESLEILTEDDWKISFVQRQEKATGGGHCGFLFPRPLTPPISVALFSGGLDSLAGAAADVGDDTAGTLILVAGRTNPRLGAVLETLFDDIGAARRRDVLPVVLPFNLRQKARQYNSNEKSQRSRGFLYAVFGAVLAAMAGGEQVVFYENGIGAINLPYSPVQFGTHSTRSTNPVALARLAAFLELYLEQPLKFRLPNLFSTKSEMCAKLSTFPLGESIPSTVTCDSFPLRHKKAAQCGTCTSCLLRRQSLWAAELEDKDSGELYFFDVVGRPRELDEKRWNPLRDMLGQVETFKRAFASLDPWEALAGEHPMLRKVAWTLDDEGVLPDSEAQRQLVSLFQRYCSEWERFHAVPPGWRRYSSDETMDWRFRDAS